MHRLCLSLTLALLFPAVAALADDTAALAPDPGDEVLERYFKATRDQKDRLREIAMEAHFDGRLPRLGRTGTMTAVRHVSKEGAVSYEVIGFQGDNSIKKEVIARYMGAEVEAAGKGRELGITTANYKFKYYGVFPSGDWKLHLFELNPRRKEVGLFRGWLWIEDATGLPIREQGEFVRSPSIFLRKVSFVRDYLVYDQVAWPSAIQSRIETRLVGAAELDIRYSGHQAANLDRFKVLAGELKAKLLPTN